MFLESQGQQSANLISVAYTTYAGNSVLQNGFRCGFISGLVLTCEHLGVRFVLKTVLILQCFSMHLNFSEMPFT
jgi:hypothetical protein